jgi:phage tail sheath protein FI
MPEYLAPGVYVEEVSYRASTIQGVPTSTTGFAGLAPFGPVYYPGGPSTCAPLLVTSFPEFELAYGKLDPILVGGEWRLPYLAHAARAFFLNGGQLLYISRVFKPNAANDTGVASVSFAVPTQAPSTATWRARWPGSMGNVAIRTTVTRSRDVGVHTGQAPYAMTAKSGTIVEVVAAPGRLPAVNAPFNPDALRIVQMNPDGTQSFLKSDGTSVPPNVADLLSIIQLNLLISVDPERTDAYSRLGLDPADSQFVGKVLDKDHPVDDNAIVWLDYDFGSIPGANAISLLLGLVGTQPPGTTVRLVNGNDGALPVSTDPQNGFYGQPADLDDATIKATGLCALGEIDDIAIEAIPDAGGLDITAEQVATANQLISHCESLQYRFAIVDGPQGASINDIREFRGNFDSEYAALYYPWIEIIDPNQQLVPGAPPQMLHIPPSGFMAGIYGRVDVARGVFKAPANEVVYGLGQFESNIDKGRDEVLNPEGINALRFFPDRGYRVWGARTLSSDPLWIYINVRRLFIYLEHSIDKATQWAVFEPNNEMLWGKIAQSVRDFLQVQWLSGALIGATADQAYFVRCDRTTMTQNDLDNGRMICLVGVAPTRPAEFVIFRIGQWTADATAS